MHYTILHRRIIYRCLTNIIIIFKFLGVRTLWNEAHSNKRFMVLFMYKLLFILKDF